jgi:hypothetical protein
MMLLTSKAFVTSTPISDHVANPTNTTDSSTLEFALSSLSAASDEQYESISDDEIVLLASRDGNGSSSGQVDRKQDP